MFQWSDRYATMRCMATSRDRVNRAADRIVPRQPPARTRLAPGNSERTTRVSRSEDRLDIGPVSVPKASDILAAQLRQRILEGKLTEGAALPSERDLVERTRLSRSTVREALRILEIQGLIATRPGRNGGSIVRRPDHSGLSDTLQMFIQGRRIRMGALLEVRESVEPLGAALAAERRTDQDLRDLEDLNARMRAGIDDETTYLEANLRWHLAVAYASHNELLAAFMHAIATAIHAGWDFPGLKADEIRRTAVRAHERVTAAIRDRDRDAAHRRMLRHVHGFAGAVLGLAPTANLPVE
jgi:GntR family transcriptional regulator, transcriptional repressor for pyruvate dehydrogenase complex